MIALTWTYFPPTCAMTFAYSFSAPTATIVPPPESDELAAGDDEQALASSATPSGTTTARLRALQPIRMSATPIVGDPRLVGMIMILSFVLQLDSR